MFELVYQSNAVASSIKSYYPTLGGAFLAGKSLSNNGCYKLAVRSPKGEVILTWK
jgi:hypothetical protein